MGKFIWVIFHLILVTFAKKRETDHPRFDIPERADTSHEGHDFFLFLLLNRQLCLGDAHYKNMDFWGHKGLE